MTHAYSDIAQLQAALPEETAGMTQARMVGLLASLAADIDRYCNAEGLRTFRVYTATLDFAPDSEILNLPDLLTVTSVAQDLNADQTYSTIWTASDYRLWPLNAPSRGEPYTQLRALPHGVRTLGWPRGWTGGFPREYLEVFRGPHAGAPSMRVVGKWGYREALEDTGATLAAAMTDTTGTTFPASDAGLISPGQTLLVDSEQMFLSGLYGGTATVERGVNGTTAATHLNAAPISRYTYPASLAEASYALTSVRRSVIGTAGVRSESVGDIHVQYGGPEETQIAAVLSQIIPDSLRRTGVFA